MSCHFCGAKSPLQTVRIEEKFEWVCPECILEVFGTEGLFQGINQDVL